MFDIGFLEIVVVGVVALIVLGPERLPGAIRTASLWIGRLRRSFNNIKQDIEKEIGADEIRRQLRNEEIMEKFRHTQNQVQNSISAIKKETDEFKKNINLEAQVAAGSRPETAGNSNAETESTSAAEPASISADQAAATPSATNPPASQPEPNSETADTTPKS